MKARKESFGGSNAMRGGVDHTQSLLDDGEFESFDLEFDMSVVSDPKATLEGYTEYHERLRQAKRRELYLWDEVDAASVAELCDMIMAYNRKDKNKSVEERKPIYLHIFSGGGDVFSGNALLDLILQSKTPVYTINDGKAFSMAGYLFIAGHKRFAFEHSVLMLHDGMLSATGDASKVEDFTDFNKKSRVRDQELVMSCSHGRMPEDEYKEHARADWYMFADYAQKRGLVDCIIGKDCELDCVIPTVKEALK